MVRSIIRRLTRLAIALLTAVGGANAATHAVDQPRYLATGLFGAPGAVIARDMNVVMWADGPELIDAVAIRDRSGHAPLPRWQATLPGVPGLVTPFAPSLGWPVDGYMRPVAAKQRPLRACLAELRQADAAWGTAYAPQAWEALRDAYDAWLDILPTHEDCTDPDIVVGVGAEDVNGGCGSPLAIACAALLPQGGRYRVRVTLNRQMAAARQYPPRGVYWSVVHEAKHAAGYGHTGDYGGEGRAHAHPSDLGYYCLQLDRPCDNPTGFPAREDFEDVPGHNIVWGIRLRPVPFGRVDDPDPAPTAIPSLAPAPSPSPSPTPPPPPPPPPDGPTVSVWVHRDDLHGPCPTPMTGDWCVVDFATAQLWLEGNHTGVFLEVHIADLDRQDVGGQATPRTPAMTGTPNRR